MPAGWLGSVLQQNAIYSSEEQRWRHPETEEFNVLGGTYAIGKTPQSLQKRERLWGKTKKMKAYTVYILISIASQKIEKF